MPDATVFNLLFASSTDFEWCRELYEADGAAAGSPPTLEEQGPAQRSTSTLESPSLIRSSSSRASHPCRTTKIKASAVEGQPTKSTRCPRRPSRSSSAVRPRVSARRGVLSQSSEADLLILT